MDIKKTVLTEEGMRYAKEGLPEKILVGFLEKKKSVSIHEAKAAIANFSIALQWAKKNGWVRVESGKIELLKRPESIPEQEALEKLAAGKEVEERMIGLLIRRNLAEEMREDIYKKAQRFVGREVAEVTEELIKTGVWKDVKFKPYDVKVRGRKIFIGKRHPYTNFLEDVRQKLVGLGFREMTGPVVELEFWNFDALFQPQDHPSRDWAQTYSLKYPKTGVLPGKKIVEMVKAAHENGWKTGSRGWGYKWDHAKAAKLMPRAHGTALSARTLASKPEIPGKYFAIARCYRPDVIDATHGVEFNQIEGIVIGESLNFRNLLGLLKDFATEFAGTKDVKFIPDYYPFTEPSVQLSARHPQLGWVEFAGAGIFRSELTEPLGVKEPVIAWGLGLDRLAMCKLSVQDIRELFSRNLEWLRSQKVV